MAINNKGSDRNPETFLEYFQWQVNRLIQWYKPKQEDNLVLLATKLLLKTIVMIVLIIFSPVVITILSIAFFAAF
jgi:hypothetical protein